MSVVVLKQSTQITSVSKGLDVMSLQENLRSWMPLRELHMQVGLKIQKMTLKR
jgi:hypothetical protein